MSIDSERDVRRALQLAAADLAPPADLAGRARRGGRRRIARRRVLAAGAGALVLAGLAGGLTVVRSGPDTPPAPASAVERLLSEPTRGDLAHDAHYREEVFAAHLAAPVQSPGNFTFRLAGDPHLAWAGTTPAGRAAAVVQPMTASRDAHAPVPPITLIRFFGDGPDGRPELVGAGESYGRPVQSDTLAFLVGADRSTLVVLDPGRPMEYSLRRTYTDTAIARTDWRPLRFDGGAAVLPVPPADADTVGVRYTNGEHAGVGNLALSRFAAPDDPLGWREPSDDDATRLAAAYLPLAGPGTPPSRDVAREVCNRAGGHVVAESADSSGRYEPGLTAETGWDWLIAGRTAAGEAVVACDLRVGADPARTVAVVRAAARDLTVYGPPVDPGSPLPVTIRLPDDRGWMVAAKGAELRYRSGVGGWRDAGRDAALLPATAVAVRVDGVEVPLPAR